MPEEPAKVKPYDRRELQTKIDSKAEKERNNALPLCSITDVQMLPDMTDVYRKLIERQGFNVNAMKGSELNHVRSDVFLGEFSIEPPDIGVHVVRALLGMKKNDPSFENMIVTKRSEMAKPRTMFGSKDGYGYIQKLLEKRERMSHYDIGDLLEFFAWKSLSTIVAKVIVGHEGKHVVTMKGREMTELSVVTDTEANR
ncbi:hypothetical protein GcC1_061032 [Golovinomyces cichoracearum]|uniref:Uncharacterized protein n=1 Tax=Golovinomyces cichoracearum TaxID=62708 RepID=A0A420ITC1_9PEZI|nr:hypothetical protein GcC1_061032 [Golovinomyces cichoracearum]